MANKDFIVKNSLVVGSTVTINGIELDLAGITTGQVLSYDGNKISATNKTLTEHFRKHTRIS